MISEDDPIVKKSADEASSLGKQQDSKKQILKSTGIVGSAQVVIILIRIVRTKAIALLLGPTGVGIFGMYVSTLELVRGATGLGLDFSAVRDVAEAHSAGDERRMARTGTTMRRWMWITGLAGAALLAVFSRQFSSSGFGDRTHTADFVVLAIVPLLSAISCGQVVLLRGARRISDMARANVFGAVVGLCTTVPLYWLWGVKGLVPAILVSAVADLGLSWLFARRLKIRSIKLSLRETIVGGMGMIRLGFFTVISGLAGSGALYLVRTMIADKAGLNSLGQFQAAWNLSATYVGMVLGAMGADYYPRLVVVSHDNAQLRQLVNEQTEVALLLSGPLIVAMLGFVDVAIQIFYTSKFGQCGDLLPWFLIGEVLKIVSWPMGFALLAKNKGLLYVLAEVIWDVLFLVLVFVFMKKAGIESTGMAFVTTNVIYTVVIYMMCIHTCDFRCTARSIKSILFSVGLCGLAFLNLRFHHAHVWRIVSLALLTTSVAYSYLELRKIVDLHQLVAKVSRKFGL